MTDRPPTAYAAEDGTQMIEIGPYQYLNRCAHDQRAHIWTKVPGKGMIVCKNCGAEVKE